MYECVGVQKEQPHYEICFVWEEICYIQGISREQN